MSTIIYITVNFYCIYLIVNIYLNVASRRKEVVKLKKVYTMSDTIKVGEEGTKKIEDFLRKNNAHIHIINVEKESYYQSKDIDLIWLYKKRNGSIVSTTLEVKTDRYQPTNFFFEVYSSVETGSQGCFMYSEADYFAYYYINHHLLFLLPLKEVREWVLANKDDFKEITARNKLNDTTYFHSLGYLVNVQSLIAAFKDNPKFKQIHITL